MTDQRLRLHELLVAALGTRNVYFQPPPNVKMKYPCIVYNRDDTFRLHADNGLYHRKKRYHVTYIDPSPVSDVADALEYIPYCTFDSHMVIDNLNHTYLTIYF